MNTCCTRSPFASRVVRSDESTATHFDFFRVLSHGPVIGGQAGVALMGHFVADREKLATRVQRTTTKAKVPEVAKQS
jgi:hypothetical protein